MRSHRRGREWKRRKKVRGNILVTDLVLNGSCEAVGPASRSVPFLPQQPLINLDYRSVLSSATLDIQCSKQDRPTGSVCA